MKTLLLTITVLFFSLYSFSQITINEVDANTPSQDVLEFVELYSATEASLDGHVLVFFNGSDDASYAAYDLDGFTISDGYFVVGNAATANVDLVIDDNSLQNGADAVALYTGDAVDFPEDTPVTTENLIDAVVYGTNDDTDLGLLALLSGGCQIQLDEDLNGDDDNQSSARIPNGGTALCPDDFVQQQPTPGESNIPSCFGGSLAFSDETTEVSLCIDDDAIEILFYSSTSSTGDNTLYVITDEDDVIINTTTEESLNTLDIPEGICRIHMIAYNGALDSESLSPGEDAADIVTDGDCISFSANYLTVTRTVCFPDCDGGTVSSDSGMNIIVCLDEEEDNLTFTHESLATDAGYWYVITDENNLLVGQVFGGMGDFNILDEGTYRVWGMSYLGDLDMSTIDPGDPLFGVSAAGCVDISEEYITVTVQECVEVEGCGDLFFSEYQEGSANNKALEIYNPTQLPISMTDYRLVNCSNGCDIEGSWDFNNDIFDNVVLQPGDVFVIAHPDADAAILSEADAEFSFLSNGDDVYALQRISTEEILDIIGENGPDPGDGWTVGGVENGTQNHTLVRMETINEGNPDWSSAQNEWEVLDQDTFENIGSHTIIPCTVSNDPLVSFGSPSIFVDEEVGMVTVSVSILNPLDEDMTVDVVLTGGSAVSPDDFDGSGFPVTLTFPAGMDDAQTIDISIVDDLMEEGAETIELELMNPSADLGIGAASFVITINASDMVIPLMSIEDAAEVDSDGIAINDGMEAELRGVVYGVNLRPTGLQFTLIDPTDGIGVFNFEGDLGYTVMEGDSIHVIGTIDQFSGLTQIQPTSITLASSDNDLVDPEVVTELNEDTESNLIKINCVEVVDPLQWTNDGSGFNVDISDGTNTYAMRIDADTDVYGSPAPTGAFSLTGIGGQFDPESPFDEGYQILPRYIEDISEALSFGYTAEFAAEDVTEQLDGGTLIIGDVVSEFLTITADNDELTYTWLIDGDEYTGSEVSIPLSVVESWVEAGQIALMVSASDGSCSSSSSSSFEVEYFINVQEIRENGITIYPNPAATEFTVVSDLTGSFVIYNQFGQQIVLEEFISSGTHKVSILGLASGVYFAELMTEQGVYRIQLIKE